MGLTNKLVMENIVKNNEDCYFYFYSSCTKGDDCPYRHCESALGTEIVCSQWKEGHCFRSSCKFRHMESRIDRKSIPCYWENQPGGCRKPHCVFFHRKLKQGIQSTSDTQKLILPVSNGELPSTLPTVKPEKNQTSNISRTENSFDDCDEGIHSPVEPFVVSFDENEESDTESVPSTPVKSNQVVTSKSSIVKTNLSSKTFKKTPQKALNFEIKSLEQIRLEKIHKESENIFKTDYEIPSLEDFKMKRVMDVDQAFPLSTDSKSLLLDENSKDDCEPNNQEEVVSQKLLKKDSLTFKIKTLEEIHKEKKSKAASESEVDKDNQTSNQQDNSVYKSKSSSLKKLKINRKSGEPLQNTNANSGKRKNSVSSPEKSKFLKAINGKRKEEDEQEQQNTITRLSSNNMETCSAVEDSEINNSLTQKSDEHSDESSFKQQEEKAKESLETECLQQNEKTINRTISIDDIDHFLKDTNVDMEETVEGGEEDLILKINEFLDS